MSSDTNIDFTNTEIAFSSLSNQQLLRAFWLFKMLSRAWIVKFGPLLAQWSLALKLPVKSFIKSTIFQHFCGGETIEESLAKVEKLAQSQVGTILDYACEGQAKADESSFDRVVDEICRTIDQAVVHPHIPFAVFKPSGIARSTLLEKKDRRLELTAAERAEFERVVERFDRICKYAFDRNVRIFVDAEETWIQDSIDKIVADMMRRYNRSRAIVYNTLQMYRRDRLEFLHYCFGDASANNYQLGVKLVRGAYLEKEGLRAKSMHYPNPLQASKEATDQDYNRALRFCVENRHRIALCAGTHNEKSNRYLTQLMKEFSVPEDDEGIYFSQLLGMSDHITYNLAFRGYRVCKYVPYGPIDLLLPYLSRRAEENSSIRGQTSRELGLIKREMQRRRLSEGDEDQSENARLPT